MHVDQNDLATLVVFLGSGVVTMSPLMPLVAALGTYKTLDTVGKIKSAF